MQPNQAPPPAPMPAGDGGQNPYDFILNSAQKPKKRPLSVLSGRSKRGRIIILSVGMSLLFIFGLMFISLLSSAGQGQTQALIGLAQDQTELLRVATIGEEKSSSTNTKNFATTAKLSLQTAQSETLAALKASGHKLSTKDLALKKDVTTDTQLEEAANNNNFDAVFIKTMQDSLQTYSARLQTIYKTSKTAAEKQMLQNDFNSVSLLLGKS